MIRSRKFGRSKLSNRNKGDPVGTETALALANIKKNSKGREKRTNAIVMHIEVSYDVYAKCQLHSQYIWYEPTIFGQSFNGQDTKILP